MNSMDVIRASRALPDRRPQRTVTSSSDRPAFERVPIYCHGQSGSSSKLDIQTTRKGLEVTVGCRKRCAWTTRPADVRAWLPLTKIAERWKPVVLGRNWIEQANGRRRRSFECHPMKGNVEQVGRAEIAGDMKSTANFREIGMTRMTGRKCRARPGLVGHLPTPLCVAFSSFFIHQVTFLQTTQITHAPHSAIRHAAMLPGGHPSDLAITVPATIQDDLAPRPSHRGQGRWGNHEGRLREVSEGPWMESQPGT